MASPCTFILPPEHIFESLGEVLYKFDEVREFDPETFKGPLLLTMDVKLQGIVTDVLLDRRLLTSNYPNTLQLRKLPPVSESYILALPDPAIRLTAVTTCRRMRRLFDNVSDAFTIKVTGDLFWSGSGRIHRSGLTVEIGDALSKDPGYRFATL